MIVSTGYQPIGEPVEGYEEVDRKAEKLYRSWQDVTDEVKRMTEAFITGTPEG